MIPVVTPGQMAAIDAAAPEPVEVLIDRAAAAVARAAVELLGGTYGRRVVVVAGPGNNGADGRVAARRLERRGVRCRVLEPFAEIVPDCDLVIDAAFGTGLTRPYSFPAVPSGVPVLAVDIPSGVDGSTGSILGRPVAADATVTFAALKPGLVLEPGRSLAGAVHVVDIGLDVSAATVDVVEGADVARWLPRRGPEAHKWNRAVRIIGGSAPMTGAPRLAAQAAQRVGAGYVQVGIPGLDSLDGPVEAVGVPLPADGWADPATAGLERVGAVLVGPGLGPGHGVDIRAMLNVEPPLVLDGDALQAPIVEACAGRSEPTVLTPHGGEFARLHPADGADPIAATAALADRSGAVVLHKGPTTVVAESDGPVLLVTQGDASLATAGTGDVLAGAVTALLAAGLDPLRAAASAAWIHAEAGRGRPGLIASDLPDRMVAVIRELLTA